MLLKRSSPTSRSRFAVWRLALWLVLLLAAFGALQYVQHARLVYAQLPMAAATDEGARSALHIMLVWDIVYLVAAALLAVLCAAAILRQVWARKALRAALTLLALWMLVSGVMLLRQWHAVPTLPSNVPPAISLRWAQMQRAVELSLAFKVLAAVLCGWLVWRLGAIAVQAQFRARGEHW